MNQDFLENITRQIRASDDDSAMNLAVPRRLVLSVIEPCRQRITDEKGRERRESCSEALTRLLELIHQHAVRDATTTESQAPVDLDD